MYIYICNYITLISACVCPCKVLVDGHAVQLQISQRGSKMASPSTANAKKSKVQGARQPAMES